MGEHRACAVGGGPICNGGQQHGEYDGRYILKLEPYYHEGCYGGQHCEVGGGLVYKMQHWYN